MAVCSTCIFLLLMSISYNRWREDFDSAYAARQYCMYLVAPALVVGILSCRKAWSWLFSFFSILALTITLILLTSWSSIAESSDSLHQHEIIWDHVQSKLQSLATSLETEETEKVDFGFIFEEHMKTIDQQFDLLMELPELLQTHKRKLAKKYGPSIDRMEQRLYQAIDKLQQAGKADVNAIKAVRAAMDDIRQRLAS